MTTDALLFPNGYRMPVFGLGTVQMNDPVEVERVLSVALDAGYRLFDTATMYGNEQYIGETLRKQIAKGTMKREDVFITTKLALVDMGCAEHMREGVRRSYDAFQLGYIDLLLIHWPFGMGRTKERELYPRKPDGRLDGVDVDFLHVWKVLEEFVDEGKVRSLGLSNFNCEQIERVRAVARHPICNVQVEQHVYLQQAELREFCQARNITVTGFFTLGSPAFMNKRVPPGDQPLLDPVVATIAKKHSKTSAQILLRFSIQDGFAVIPKSANPSRLRTNIQVFDFTIAPEDMDRLRALGKKNKRLFTMRSFFEHLKEYPWPSSRL